MIEVHNLVKRYGQIMAIDHINFHVEKGEIVGFLGPNGAGKTTTMKILAGYMPPTSGSAIVAGFDVFKNPIEIKRKIGYLPEIPPVYPDLTIEEYLNFVAKIKEVPSKLQKKQINEVMEKVKISDRRHQLIGNLSKGYTQRVGLAQALLGNSEVLILDEPTVGLDPMQIIEIRNLIKELAQEKTIFLSSHILSEVSQTCQRIIIINKGKIVASGTAQELENKLNPFVLYSLKIANTNNKEKLVENLSKVDIINNIYEKADNVFTLVIKANAEITPEIAEIVVKGNFGLLELKKETLSLEDLYLKLVSEDYIKNDVTSYAPEISENGSVNENEMDFNEHEEDNSNE